MASNLHLNSFLTGNVDEDAATITDALQQIRELLSERKPLANKIPFIVKEKSQNEKARSGNILHYVIDRKTVDLLEQYHSTWLKNPALFDDYITLSQWAAMNPWTRVTSTHLETEQDIF